MENGAVCVEIAYEAAGVDRIYQRSSNSLRSVLVQLCFDFYMIESRPENLIGYRAYDSDALDEELRQQGIEMIAPHRSNRVKSLTRPSQASPLSKALAGRTLSWIQWRRRLLVRWEFYPQNFLGFVQLACLLILFRQF